MGMRMRRYSAGLRWRDLPGLWRRDWRRAYAILTRDHAEENEPRGWLRRSWYRTKTLFLELSYKLSPPRRLLFALCVILALVGLQTEHVEVTGDSIKVWEHPALLVVSIVGLLFLLIVELADRVVVRDELEQAPLQAAVEEKYAELAVWRSKQRRLWRVLAI